MLHTETDYQFLHPDQYSGMNEDPENDALRDVQTLAFMGVPDEALNEYADRIAAAIEDSRFYELRSGIVDDIANRTTPAGAISGERCPAEKIPGDVDEAATYLSSEVAAPVLAKYLQENNGDPIAAVRAFRASLMTKARH